jgi:hypothetical protein
VTSIDRCASRLYAARFSFLWFSRFDYACLVRCLGVDSADSFSIHAR